MPLPTPNDSEDQSAFFDRCMSELSDEYTDESQRSAVCHRQWSGADDDESRENARMRSTSIRQFSGQDTDLDAIRKVAGNKDLPAEQVFDFPKFIIARSGRNHNNTEITSEAQRGAVKDWIGHAVYFEDHLTTARNQIARIYSTWVEERKNETVTMGRAYAIKCESDADLLAKIQNGIHREMSCGYYPLKSQCSLCQSDTTRSDCVTHANVPEYYARDLQIKPDHVSFVGRPGVEGAGLILNAQGAGLGRVSPESLRLHRLAQDGEQFRQWASNEFSKWYRLNNRDANQDEIDGMTEKLSAKDMLHLAGIHEREYRKVIPDGSQQLVANKPDALEQMQRRTAEEIKQSILKGKS